MVPIESANEMCRTLRLMCVAPLELHLGTSAQILPHSDMQRTRLPEHRRFPHPRPHVLPPTRIAEQPPQIEGVCKWRNITIALIITVFGEQKAQSCENACSQQLCKEQ